MEIGNLKLNSRVILAPMAGVTDYPFRQVVRSLGCELLFTEMISCKGLVYGNQNTVGLLDFSRKGGLIGVQIFGSEPDFMKKAAIIIESKYEPDLIDINMGCPTPKIVKNGAGAALMKDLNLAGKIIETIKKAVEIPVTVKMRTGWDKKRLNAGELTKIAEEQGASAVTIHGRTRNQFYKGKADWDLIAEINQQVEIPVIGNGDIFTPEAAREKLINNKCSAVMIARGIQGNPWLIKRIDKYIKTNELLDKPTFAERIELALSHLEKAADYFGEKRGVLKMRKHLSWYIKGMPYSNKVKDRINQSKSLAKTELILKSYLNKFQDPR